MTLAYYLGSTALSTVERARAELSCLELGQYPDSGRLFLGATACNAAKCLRQFGPSRWIGDYDYIHPGPRRRAVNESNANPTVLRLQAALPQDAEQSILDRRFVRWWCHHGMRKLNAGYGEEIAPKASFDQSDEDPVSCQGESYEARKP